MCLIDSMIDNTTLANNSPPHCGRTVARVGSATGFVGGIVLLLLVGCGNVPDNEYKPPPPPPVTVAHPLEHPVVEYLEENGETEAVNRAEVRARVRGFLKEPMFVPGQRVKKDDELFLIQPEEYEAAVNSASARLAAAAAAIDVAKSQVGLAQVELKRSEDEFNRYAALLKQEAATQAQYDQADAAYKSAQANVAAADANVKAAEAERQQADADLEQAELDFSYTTVKAPIDGRVTKTEVKEGNLVENGDLLATVVDQEQIYANFNISDRALLRLLQAAVEESGGEPREEDRYRGRPAQLRRELDEGYPFTGALDYVDQEGVDQETGTFSVRAVFENPDDLILPGLFVRIRVPLVEPEKAENALLIPEKALLRDQMGSYVLLVNDSNEVERRNVTSGQTIAGMVVVEEGLSVEDLVLLEGGQKARPGTEVEPTTEPLGVPAGLSDHGSSSDDSGPAGADTNDAGDGSDPASTDSGSLD